MKVLSLFSGVGGFDLGLENAGMETVFQCEWDKHATKILERHWPDVPRWTDVSTLTGAYVLQHAPVIDVVAWGSPCQDLSVAGKRAGLSGERSGLFHEGIRIIKEIRELTNGKYPRISVWENVAGALSSGAGADFGQVLYEMDEAGACFSEWRLLDAQYFGVPQRRRRVFVISVFDPATAERCPNPLLPVSEGVRWHPATSGTTRETVAGTTQESFGSGSYGGWNETDTAITLSARDHKSSNTIISEPFTGTSHAQYGPGVGTLRANGGDLAGGSETLLVEPFVKAKRAQSATDDLTWVEGDINPTINQFDQGDVRATTVIAFASNQRSEIRDLNDKAVALSAEPGTNQQTYVATPILIDGRRVDDVRVYDPPVQTLQERMGTGGNNVPVIGFSHTQGLSAQPSETAWPTLRTEGAGMAVAFTTEQTPKWNDNQALTLTGGSPSGGGQPQAVAYSIREDAKANTFSATELDRANALNSLRPSPQSHHAQMFITESYDEYNDRLGGEVHHALRAGTKQSTGVAISEVVGTLRSGGDGGVPSSRGEHLVVNDAAGFKPGASANAHSIGYEEGLSPSLEAGGGGNNRPAVLEPTMSVRRLTPLECERLMGWPDDWTAGQSDTHRYKQCGNGVASPVAQWIGEQIINL